MEQVEVTFIVTRDENGSYEIIEKETGEPLCLWHPEGQFEEAFDHVHGCHEDVDPSELEHNRMCDHADECRKAQNERG